MNYKEMCRETVLMMMVARKDISKATITYPTTEKAINKVKTMNNFRARNDEAYLVQIVRNQNKVMIVRDC